MKTFYEMMRIMEQDQEETQGPEQGLGDEQGANPDQASGDMSQEPAPQNTTGGSGMERKHYMFFSNLKAIKEKAEAMLSMDPAKVDEMLADGHDWASDHISTSRDDVEEVYNWLSGSVEDQSGSMEQGA